MNTEKKLYLIDHSYEMVFEECSTLALKSLTIISYHRIDAQAVCGAT